MSVRALAPPNDGVKCEVDEHSNGELWVYYWGSSDDLIAAGAATPEMLVLLARSQRPRRRVDADGDRYFRDSYFISRRGPNGEPVAVPRFKVVRRKPRERAMLLPGVMEWLEKYRAEDDGELEAERARQYEAYLSWQRAQKPKQSPAPKPRPQHLRLIVDNTRGRVQP